ncbi:hypothetical protein [Plantactinospora mayteni]|nr:hypothetical protein [Plantactinospora mayteni]
MSVLDEWTRQTIDELGPDPAAPDQRLVRDLLPGRRPSGAGR